MTALLANFTGADGTLITSYTSDSGHTFTMNTGTSGRILGNRAKGTIYGGYTSNYVPASADCAAEANIKFLSQDANSQCGIELRITGSTFYNIFHGNGLWYVYKNISGTGTQLGSTVAQTLTSDLTYKLKAQVIGSTIKFWTDNADGTYVLRATITDSSIPEAGAIGFYNANYSGLDTTGYLVDSLAETAIEATTVTTTGPTSGLSGVASTNFTVGANGAITGTVIVTPSDGGGGGTFTPTTVSISSGSPTGTFTYTPSSTGAKTISVTNNGSLTNPSNITYTVTVAATAVTMTGPTSGVSGAASTNFTIGANGSITGTVVVTPSDAGGGGSFTPTTVSISSGAPTGTFTYTPGSVGAKTISVTNSGSLANPSNITYTASSSAATAVTMTGPTSGTTGVASTNFTVGANGTITGTVIVTPSDGGGGGTFTPTTVSISSGSPTGTFTYTPASAGAKTISEANNGSLTNASNITYTASAAAGTLTLIGPSACANGTASDNFTVSLSGTIVGTVTITPSDGGGGSFAPTSLPLTSGSPSGTFTYTPASTGAKSISVTNSSSYTNPTAVALVSYTSGSLAAGAAGLSSVTTTTITVACTAGSGGTGGLTYQWYRKTDPGQAIGVHNLLAGATSLTLADSAGLSIDIPYWYVCRVTDSSGAVAYPKMIAGTLAHAPLVIGFIGDSITYGQGLSAGQTVADQIPLILNKFYRPRTVTAVNQGHSGSMTTDWMSGSMYLNTARTAFAAAGVTYVHIMLGANDCGTISAPSFAANLANIIGVLVGDGYKVILSYPTFITDGPGSSASSPANQGRYVSYCAAIDTLVNGATVLRGDVHAYNYFILTYGTEYQSDQVHLNATGAVSLAQMWARAIDRAIYSPDRPVPKRTVTCTFQNKAGTPQASLAGLKWQWSDVAGNVIDAGTGATTDASGVFTVTVHSYLPIGGVGFLVVTSAAGVVNNTYVSFAGPAVVS